MTDRQVEETGHMSMSADRRAVIATYLMKRIDNIQPGQEEELEALERDLDGWLRLNHLESLGERLRQQIADRRAALAAWPRQELVQ
jgi:hypothetical protein